MLFAPIIRRVTDKSVTDRAKVSQHQYLLYGIKHTKTIKKNLWLYTAVVLLMMGANSIQNM
jgi:hypothetical protein